MMQILRWLLVSLSIVLLTACGGGGGGGDTTPPFIKIIGGNPTTLNRGTTYTDAGALAVDSVDGEVAVTIVSNSVDTSVVGTYHIVYKAEDSSGNEANATREVRVVEPDTTPPVITIQGDNPITILADSTYSDAGASATDNIDGAVSVSTIENSVDTSTVGEYRVVYSTKDSSDSESNATRTVYVITHQPKKTGQVVSYDKDGDINDSIKDDGYYQSGVTPRYSRDDTTEIVTDYVTGLQWADNNESNSTKKQWLTDENYDTCHNDKTDPACHDTSGDTATTYCEALELGGYTDWRLPNSKELMSIADKSKRNPAIDATFHYIVSVYYWSSTTVVGYKDNAWGVGFNSGYDDLNYKFSSFYVRCVRARD